MADTKEEAIEEGLPEGEEKVEKLDEGDSTPKEEKSEGGEADSGGKKKKARKSSKKSKSKDKSKKSHKHKDGKSADADKKDDAEEVEASEDVGGDDAEQSEAVEADEPDKGDDSEKPKKKKSNKGKGKKEEEGGEKDEEEKPKKKKSKRHKKKDEDKGEEKEEEEGEKEEVEKDEEEKPKKKRSKKHKKDEDKGEEKEEEEGEKEEEEKPKKKSKKHKKKDEDKVEEKEEEKEKEVEEKPKKKKSKKHKKDEDKSEEKEEEEGEKEEEEKEGEKEEEEKEEEKEGEGEKELEEEKPKKKKSKKQKKNDEDKGEEKEEEKEEEKPKKKSRKGKKGEEKEEEKPKKKKPKKGKKDEDKEEEKEEKKEEEEGEKEEEEKEEEEKPKKKSKKEKGKAKKAEDGESDSKKEDEGDKGEAAPKASEKKGTEGKEKDQAAQDGFDESLFKNAEKEFGVGIFGKKIRIKHDNNLGAVKADSVTAFLKEFEEEMRSLKGDPYMFHFLTLNVDNYSLIIHKPGEVESDEEKPKNAKITLYYEAHDKTIYIVYDITDGKIEWARNAASVLNREVELDEKSKHSFLFNEHIKPVFEEYLKRTIGLDLAITLDWDSVFENKTEMEEEEFAKKRKEALNRLTNGKSIALLWTMITMIVDLAKDQGVRANIFRKLRVIHLENKYFDVNKAINDDVHEDDDDSGGELEGEDDEEEKKEEEEKEDEKIKNPTCMYHSKEKKLTIVTFLSSATPIPSVKTFVAELQKPFIIPEDFKPSKRTADENKEQLAECFTLVEGIQGDLAKDASIRPTLAKGANFLVKINDEGEYEDKLVCIEDGTYSMTLTAKGKPKLVYNFVDVLEVELVKRDDGSLVKVKLKDGSLSLMTEKHELADFWHTGVDVLGRNVRREIQHVVATLLPIYQSTVKVACGESIDVEVDWDSFGSIRKPIMLVSALEKVLKSLFASLSKVYFDEIGKNGFLRVVKKIVIKRLEKNTPYVWMESGTLFENFTVSKKGVDMEARERRASMLNQWLGLTASRLKVTIEKEKIPEFRKRLSTTFGDPEEAEGDDGSEPDKLVENVRAMMRRLVIEIDWKSLSAGLRTGQLRELGLKQLFESKLIFEKILTVFGDLAADQHDKEIILQKFKKIEVVYATKKLEQDLAKKLKLGTVAVGFSIEPREKEVVQSLSVPEFKKIIEDGFGLLSTRFRVSVEAKIPALFAKFEEKAGSKLEIECDYESFSRCPVAQQSSIYKELPGKNVLGKLAAILFELANTDDETREEIADTIKGIHVSYDTKGASPSIREGVLREVLTVPKKAVVAATKEQWKETVAKFLRLREKTEIRNIEKFVPNIKNTIAESFDCKEFELAVLTEECLKAEDELGILRKLPTLIKFIESLVAGIATESEEFKEILSKKLRRITVRFDPEENLSEPKLVPFVSQAEGEDESGSSEGEEEEVEGEKGTLDFVVYFGDAMPMEKTVRKALENGLGISSLRLKNRITNVALKDANLILSALIDENPTASVNKDSEGEYSLASAKGKGGKGKKKDAEEPAEEPSVTFAVDWESFEDLNLNLLVNALKFMLSGEFVFQRIYRTAAYISRTFGSAGKEAFRTQIESVMFKYGRSTENESSRYELRKTGEKYTLDFYFEVSRQFESSVASPNAREVASYIASVFGLDSDKAAKSIEENASATIQEKLRKSLGSAELTVKVDFDSFRTCLDDAPTLFKKDIFRKEYVISAGILEDRIVGENVLGKLERVIEGLAASHPHAIKKFAEKITEITIKNAEKEGFSINDGTLELLVAVKKDAVDLVHSPADEAIRKMIIRTLGIPEKEGGDIFDHYIPLYEAALTEVVGRSVTLVLEVEEEKRLLDDTFIKKVSAGDCGRSLKPLLSVLRRVCISEKGATKLRKSISGKIILEEGNDLSFVLKEKDIVATAIWNVDASESEKEFSRFLEDEFTLVCVPIKDYVESFEKGEDEDHDEDEDEEKEEGDEEAEEKPKKKEVPAVKPKMEDYLQDDEAATESFTAIGRINEVEDVRRLKKKTGVAAQITVGERKAEGIVRLAGHHAILVEAKKLPEIRIDLGKLKKFEMTEKGELILTSAEETVQIRFEELFDSLCILVQVLRRSSPKLDLDFKSISELGVTLFSEVLTDMQNLEDEVAIEVDWNSFDAAYDSNTALKVLFSGHGLLGTARNVIDIACSKLAPKAVPGLKKISFAYSNDEPTFSFDPESGESKATFCVKRDLLHSARCVPYEKVKAAFDESLMMNALRVAEAAEKVVALRLAARLESILVKKIEVAIDWTSAIGALHALKSMEKRNIAVASVKRYLLGRVAAAMERVVSDAVGLELAKEKIDRVVLVHSDNLDDLQLVGGVLTIPFRLDEGSIKEEEDDDDSESGSSEGEVEVNFNNINIIENVDAVKTSELLKTISEMLKLNEWRTAEVFKNFTLVTASREITKLIDCKLHLVVDWARTFAHSGGLGWTKELRETIVPKYVEVMRDMYGDSDYASSVKTWLKTIEFQRALPELSVGEGKIVEAFDVPQSGELEQVVLEDLKKRIEKSLRLSEKKKRAEFESTTIPEAGKAMRDATGNPKLSLSIDFSSMEGIPQEMEALEMIDSPEVIGAIKDCLSIICKDELAKKQVRKLKNIVVKYRTERSTEAKEVSHFDGSTFYFVLFIVVSGAERRQELPSFYELLSLFRNHLKLERRSRQEHLMKKEDYFRESCEMAVGQKVPLHFHRESMKGVTGGDERIFTDLLRSAELLEVERLLASLRELGKRDIGRDSFLSSVSSVIVAGAGRTVDTGLSLRDGELHYCLGAGKEYPGHVLRPPQEVFDMQMDEACSIKEDAQFAEVKGEMVPCFEAYLKQVGIRARVAVDFESFHACGSPREAIGVIHESVSEYVIWRIVMSLVLAHKLDAAALKRGVQQVTIRNGETKKSILADGIWSVEAAFDQGFREDEEDSHILSVDELFETLKEGLKLKLDSDEDVELETEKKFAEHAKDLLLGYYNDAVYEHYVTEKAPIYEEISKCKDAKALAEVFKPVLGEDVSVTPESMDIAKHPSVLGKFYQLMREIEAKAAVRDGVFAEYIKRLDIHRIVIEDGDEKGSGIDGSTLKILSRKCSTNEKIRIAQPLSFWKDELDKKAGTCVYAMVNAKITEELIEKHREKMKADLNVDELAEITFDLDSLQNLSRDERVAASNYVVGDVLQSVIVCLEEVTRDNYGRKAFMEEVSKIKIVHGVEPFSYEDKTVTLGFIVNKEPVGEEWMVEREGAEFYALKFLPQTELVKKLEEALDLPLVRTIHDIENRTFYLLREKILEIVGKGMLVTADWASFESAENPAKELEIVVGKVMPDVAVEIIEKACTGAAEKKCVSDLISHIHFKRGKVGVSIDPEANTLSLFLSDGNKLEEEFADDKAEIVQNALVLIEKSPGLDLCILRETIKVEWIDEVNAILANVFTDDKPVTVNVDWSSLNESSDEMKLLTKLKESIVLFKAITYTLSGVVDLQTLVSVYVAVGEETVVEGKTKLRLCIPEDGDLITPQDLQHKIEESLGLEKKATFVDMEDSIEDEKKEKKPKKSKSKDKIKEKKPKKSKSKAKIKEGAAAEEVEAEGKKEKKPKKSKSKAKIKEGAADEEVEAEGKKEKKPKKSKSKSKDKDKEGAAEEVEAEGKKEEEKEKKPKKSKSKSKDKEGAAAEEVEAEGKKEEEKEKKPKKSKSKSKDKDKEGAAEEVEAEGKKEEEKEKKPKKSKSKSKDKDKEGAAEEVEAEGKKEEEKEKKPKKSKSKSKDKDKEGAAEEVEAEGKKEEEKEKKPKKSKSKSKDKDKEGAAEGEKEEEKEKKPKKSKSKSKEKSKSKSKSKEKKPKEEEEETPAKAEEEEAQPEAEGEEAGEVVSEEKKKSKSKSKKKKSKSKKVKEEAKEEKSEDVPTEDDSKEAESEPAPEKDDE